MSGVEKACFAMWKMIQLTLIFHLFTICGALLLGFGPAWQTIVALSLETNQEEKHYSLARAFELWKSNFMDANIRFLSCALVFGALGINLHLALQFQSILWLVLSFVIMLVMLWIIFLWFYMSFYAATYDITLIDNAKLAFMSIFLSFKQFLLTVSVLLGVFFVTWQYKGLYLFLSFGALVFLLDRVTKPNRDLVDGAIND